MRWIVISLVLVNALILGWRWYDSQQEPTVAGNVRPAESRAAIELLPDGTVQPVPVQAAVTEPLLVPAVDELDPATNPDAEAELVSGSPDQPIATAPAVSDTLPAVPAAASQCAWTEWTAVPVSAEVGVEPIRTETREQELGRSYLVHIPAKGRRELTLARLAEVKALGFEAAFLNKGPQVGGISLGLFSKPESMQSRLAELQRAGVLDALGIERVRTESQQRQLLRWVGEKTPTSVQNQALISCNDVAPPAAGQ